MHKKKEVIIYTDGACSGNPGPGGWAAFIITDDQEKAIFGTHSWTTNQRMELTAAVEALKSLKEPSRVRLYSDSAYLINAFNQGWLDKWEKNNWRTSRGEAVEHQDLWRELLRLSRLHQVEWIKVKGHGEDAYNRRCDHLARKAIRLLKALDPYENSISQGGKLDNGPDSGN